MALFIAFWSGLIWSSFYVNDNYQIMILMKMVGVWQFFILLKLIEGFIYIINGPE